MVAKIHFNAHYIGGDFYHLVLCDWRDRLIETAIVFPTTLTNSTVGITNSAWGLSIHGHTYLYFDICTPKGSYVGHGVMPTYAGHSLNDQRKGLYSRGDQNNVAGCYSSHSLKKPSHTNIQLQIILILFPINFKIILTSGSSAFPHPPPWSRPGSISSSLITIVDHGLGQGYTNSHGNDHFQLCIHFDAIIINFKWP